MNDPAPGAAVLLSADLMTGSKASGAAAGHSVLVAMTPAAAIDRVRQQAARLLLIDLTTPRLDLPALLAELRQLPQPVATVAFGPHVHEAALAAAQAAGCDRVVSRGEFHARLAALLAHYLDRPAEG